MSTIRATYVQHGSSSVPNITLNASGQVVVASGIVSSGTFAAPSGTAAAPGIYFDGDADTGLYSPGANQVAISTNGTGRLFIDSSGNVGVGTTSVDELLHVEGSASGGTISAKIQNNVGAASSDAALKLTTNSDTWQLTSKYDGAAFALSNGAGEKLRVDTSGRLLVGTSSSTNAGSTVGALVQTRFSGSFTNFAAIRESGPSVSVFGRANGNAAQIVSNNDVLGEIRFAGADGVDLETQAASIACAVDGTPGANDMPGRLVFSTTADGAASPTERMRIDNSGKSNFYRNTATTTSQIISAQSDVGGAASTVFYVRANGGIGNFQANDVNLSDRNTKKDIEPASATWDCVKDWEIVNYRYLAQPNTDNLNIGVIAQQVAEICPEVITVFQQATESEPERLGVKEQQMYWMAIKALQEAQVRIETLEAKVAALEAS